MCPTQEIGNILKNKNKIEKRLDITPIGDALVEPESSIADEASTQKRAFISLGERIHKWGTYLSVDWVFNAATGVGFAYWGKYTQLGQKLWSGPLTRGFTKLLKPFIKDPHQLKSSAGYGNMFMSVIAGGMFTIPPLMFLENNKVKKSITQSLDEKLYGKDEVENNPKFAAAYDAIERAPKKDFSSGLLSRFAALSPLLAMVLIPTSKKISNKLWFDHVERASGTVAHKMGFSPRKSFKNTPVPVAKERWKFIHESVAMDFGLGIPYAILHAFFYNLFASRKEKANGSSESADIPIAVAKANDPPAAPGYDKKWVDATQDSKLRGEQMAL